MPYLGAALAGLAVGVAYELGRKSRSAIRPARGPESAPGPVTPSQVRVSPADTPLGEPGRNTDQRLDEAIQETFPASDPISLKIEK